MNALDKVKFQDMELVGIKTNQFHSLNVKQATAQQTHRNNQTRSRRQKDYVVNEIEHVKWISELGEIGNGDGM